MFQLSLPCAATAADKTPAAAHADPLLTAFVTPPSSARPRVWWHWLSGNVSEEGIRLDLEWMHRIGIGGFQTFDASMGTPPVVPIRLAYMTAPWQHAFRYAVSLANQLGLESAIAGSPGWSESGGPWVTPPQAMKKLVWSELTIAGGQHFHGTLPRPPTVSGPYQDLRLFDFSAIITGQRPSDPPEYYADSVVVAARLPDGSAHGDAIPVRASSNRGPVSREAISDGRLATRVSLPVAPVGESTWIEFEFSAPETVRSITYSSGDPVVPFGLLGPPQPPPDLEASEDGRAFRTILTLPDDGAPAHTVSLPATTARFFRLTFQSKPIAPPQPGKIDFSGLPMPPLGPRTELNVAEFVLHREPRVNRIEEKAGFETLTDLYRQATPQSDAPSLGTAAVLDLTSSVGPDGILDWTPPAGDWLVLRFGYSLTGVTNHPASPEGTGLEVDKLSGSAVKAYMERYLDSYAAALGSPIGDHGLQCVINDSWEAGGENWTDAMLTEFATRRGYDPKPWMPVLAGRVVGSAAASDAFLWDFRRTLADLVTENHFDQISRLVHARGLCHYGESHEMGRAFIGDGMDAKRTNDIPMSAMWTQRPGVNEEQFGYAADVRESASVAHLYGQNLVAAESLTAGTAPYGWSPALLKPTADEEFLNGVNRIVIHTSVHQPLTDRTPGLSLGPFGQWFTRNETWAGLAKPWIDYLARCSSLLQQGHYVADIAYLYGEDTNLTALFADHAPAIPRGYSFDYVSADALQHRLTVDRSELVTASGMRYRVLVLDPSSRFMSLASLRRIAELVRTGATVVGSRPVGTPSLADDPAEFARIADELWGKATARLDVGRGRVVPSDSLNRALGDLALQPDLKLATSEDDDRVRFVHRSVEHAHLYFIVNRSDQPLATQATVRVRGREAELWHPDTGLTEPADYSLTGDTTRVPLRLAPRESVFLVFRRPTGKATRHTPASQETEVGRLDGPWTVYFPPNRGAPAAATLKRLASWSDSPDPGVRYFSGTATYARDLKLPDLQGHARERLWLDLGDVQNLAEVRVNGRSAGILWKPPFRVDISKLVRPGTNRLEIRVTNLWVNRMIGDRQPDVVEKITYSVPERYAATSPLLPSGLLGPVRILSITAGATPAP